MQLTDPWYTLAQQEKNEILEQILQDIDTEDDGDYLIDELEDHSTVRFQYNSYTFKSIGDKDGNGEELDLSKDLLSPRYFNAQARF